MPCNFKSFNLIWINYKINIIHLFYILKCVSHLHKETINLVYLSLFLLIHYKKKGVEISYLFYLSFRSWRTYAVDKTIAPHRFAI